MIRSFCPEDLDELRKIHEQYFANEFNFPDFMNFICVFVIEDEKGIITAGGIRDIAECVAVTNMSRAPKERLAALYQLLDASVFVCGKSKYDQMYVWSQNPKYTRRLMRNNFRLPQGQSLILDL
jgi:citrate lyase synthetase